MTVQSAYQEEQDRLTKSLNDIMTQLQAIGPRYKGDDFTEQMLDLQQEERRLRLEISRREPYFGRVDFEELPDGEMKPLYIGKAGVAKKDSNELLVIDWRAPAASVFYSFTGGESPASYESPDGQIEGHVHLKRNFMIRQGEIVRLVDSYVRGQEEGSVTDEFLLYRLGENKDNKLRDIVSTIQGEQDRIIRADRSKALFIQGVAGSGKTTVALHRLAFLLYQYADRMRAERMIIFAPNRMFLDYISGVLPELGVGDIQQTTFSDWTVELLEKTISVSDASEAMSYWFEERRTAEEIEQASGRFKGSLDFKAIVDERIADVEQRIVPVIPFTPIDRMELSPEQMREWYETDYGDETLMKKRDRLVSRIRRWMESELKMKGIADKKIRAKALTKFNSFTKKIPSYTALQLYASMFSGKQLVASIPKRIAAATAERLKKEVAAAEDLAPLAYIQLQLFGLPKQAFDHIVIDEAQDYSPFQLEVLRLCQRTASMTVLGDLQQGIHAYAGVQSWSELTALFEEEQLGYFELNRSYRSTMEIIEFANKILGSMIGEVKPAVPVFRSGDPVIAEPVTDKEWLRSIAETVREWQAKGEYETISVIGRTALQCETIHLYLQENGLDASLVQSKQPAYGGGLSVVPVYLSKGLEFDAVLIADASAEDYSPLDAKLLYVGCTRALHKLKLYYRGELTMLLGE
ncbi:DNA helicase-2/ATP-dependent DNA helicase PcrA [Paenibacillus endophyticus]|uniref:DNA helicase-2/ATP-dependent DNA helicase PcrA n=1 Tax=Paenibacillus endophyticus TaxID=1294268 RepID=A0A7W5GA60_9BACL|nr:UvrD-helicase domain-containing protein [Paenibacillus endophyticus]MBB3151988.1 DNA helicase-2/ATP-dependent DNA helicase PcrA [Paenibacillus endophyticus]